MIFGTPIKNVIVLNLKKHEFIVSREKMMVEDEWDKYSHPDPKFIGKFSGKELEQFEIYATSKRNIKISSLKLLSRFSGTIEEHDGCLTITSYCKSTGLGKISMAINSLIYWILVIHLIANFEHSQEYYFPLLFISAFFIALFMIKMNLIQNHIWYFTNWFIQK